MAIEMKFLQRNCRQVTALVLALGLPGTYLLYLSALSFLVLLGAVLYTPKPARKGGGA